MNDSALPRIEKEGIQKDLVKAERWHKFLTVSRGEHNIYLASEIIRREDKLLSEIGKKLKTKLDNLTRLPLISGNYCSTLCHSKAGVEVPPDIVKTSKGGEMSHSSHMKVMRCVQCHDIGVHKDVP